MLPGCVHLLKVPRVVLGGCHLLPPERGWRCRALAHPDQTFALPEGAAPYPAVPKVPAAPEDESWEQENTFPIHVRRC